MLLAPACMLVGLIFGGAETHLEEIRVNDNDCHISVNPYGSLAHLEYQGHHFYLPAPDRGWCPFSWKAGSHVAYVCGKETLVIEPEH